MYFQNSISNIYNRYIQHYPKVQAAINRLNRSIDIVVNQLALGAFALCNLFLFYMHPILFTVSLPLGIVFPKFFEGLDNRIKRVWEHNIGLLLFPFFPWGIIAMPGLLILTTVYSAARLSMLINFNSRNKEIKKIDEVVKGVMKTMQSTISTYYSEPTRLSALESLSQEAIKTYREKTKLNFYTKGRLENIFRERIKKLLDSECRAIVPYQHPSDVRITYITNNYYSVLF